MDKAKMLGALEKYKRLMGMIPNHGIGKFIKVESTLVILNCLENIITSMNNDPYPLLCSSISNQFQFLEETAKLREILDKSRKKECQNGELDKQEQSIALFQDAWTTYGRETYEHSVQLIRDRLISNGFDENFFSGKVCFDGGCGTGRFSIAMAELGAKQVVAADLGDESLAMASTVAREYKLDNIEFVKQDITDLRKWNDRSFDFVASNGVLHHTVEAERGICEHFRITKNGGTFWLYLYGDGGIYWFVYDQMKMLMKDLKEKEVKQILIDFNIREGLIYTFLDNVMAPIRKYYYTSNIVKMLKKDGSFSYSNLKGSSEIDDTAIVLGTRYGKEIYGNEGEVRIRIDKI
jgi:ubiquinone/menaquinone biosynthesis C-methylase UbiE